MGFVLFMSTHGIDKEKEKADRFVLLFFPFSNFFLVRFFRITLCLPLFHLVSTFPTLFSPFSPSLFNICFIFSPWRSHQFDGPELPLLYLLCFHPFCTPGFQSYMLPTLFHLFHLFPGSMFSHFSWCVTCFLHFLVILVLHFFYVLI